MEVCGNIKGTVCTFCGVHAPHSEHGPHSGFAGSGTGALQQRLPLRQEVILHPLHQQPLALHAVPQQRVGLQVGQELHTQGHVTTAINKQSNKCRVFVYCMCGLQCYP